MSNIEKTVLESMIGMLPPGAEVEVSTKLADLRISSIKILRLITKMEAEFGVEFSAGDLATKNFETVATLIALVRSKVEVSTRSAQ